MKTICHACDTEAVDVIADMPLCQDHLDEAEAKADLETNGD